MSLHELVTRGKVCKLEYVFVELFFPSLRFKGIVAIRQQIVYEATIASTFDVGVEAFLDSGVKDAGRRKGKDNGREQCVIPGLQLLSLFPFAARPLPNLSLRANRKQKRVIRSWWRERSSTRFAPRIRLTIAAQSLTSRKDTPSTFDHCSTKFLLPTSLARYGKRKLEERRVLLPFRPEKFSLLNREYKCDRSPHERRDS